MNYDDISHSMPTMDDLHIPAHCLIPLRVRMPLKALLMNIKSLSAQLEREGHPRVERTRCPLISLCPRYEASCWLSE